MNIKIARFFKKCRLAILCLCATLFLIEFISYAGLAAILRTFQVQTQIHKLQSRGIAHWEEQDVLNWPFSGNIDLEIVHPYFGYVLRKKTPQDRYGFGNTVKPVQKKAKDKVIVALLGGSVAQDFFKQAIQELVHELKQSKKFEGKEIVPINLAMGGYKQPQQMMVINYFLAVGAEFDIVINLDGFNEVTSPIAENRVVNVSATFPREWRTRVDPLEPWALKPIMMKKILSRIRFQTRLIFLTFPLSHSYTAMCLWKFIDDLLYRSIYHYHRQYFYELPKRELENLGPYREFVREDELYSFLVNLWKSASLNIDLLSRHYQFAYYHFLQPNLHIEDSKIWSARERQFREKPNLYPELIKKGYPLLKSGGKELVKSGIRFYDLTQIFQNEPKTMYTDDCCHLRVGGSKILARAIGKIIAGDYQDLKSA